MSNLKENLTMGEQFNILVQLITELEDGLDFLQTFEGMPQSIGCVCEAESEENCCCVDEKGRHKRIENKVGALNNARTLLEQFTDRYKLEEVEGKSVDSYRICSDCENIMTEGYLIEQGLAYYCSDNCLNKHMTQEEYLELYDNGNSETYWTTWE